MAAEVAEWAGGKLANAEFLDYAKEIARVATAFNTEKIPVAAPLAELKTVNARLVDFINETRTSDKTATIDAGGCACPRLEYCRAFGAKAGGAMIPLSGETDSDIGFWAPESGCWDLEVGFRVAESGRWDSGGGFWVAESGRWDSDGGFWVAESGRWDSDGGFVVAESGSWDSDIDFWVAERRFSDSGGHFRAADYFPSCAVGVNMV